MTYFLSNVKFCVVKRVDAVVRRLQGIQAVSGQKEFSDSHDHDAAVIQQRPEIVSGDDDFPECVRYVRKRVLLQLTLLGGRHVQGGLHIVVDVKMRKPRSQK